MRSGIPPSMPLSNSLETLRKALPSQQAATLLRWQEGNGVQGGMLS